ncbi:MAG: TIGR03067 domain-containing protein [Dehalococcoidia bacterium]
MKKFFLSIIPVLIITIVIVGCGSSDTSSSGNTELQGTWVGILTETCYTPPCRTYDITFTFNGDDLAVTNNGKDISGTFTLNTVANPKTIDFYIVTDEYGPEYEGKTAMGIYQLNGSNLELALGEAGGVRPTSFAEDNSIILIKQ